MDAWSLNLTLGITNKVCICSSAESDSGISCVFYFGERHCHPSVAQDQNLKVIITSLLFLTPHIQLAEQSCWFYDLNVYGTWPLLFLLPGFGRGLGIVSPFLAASILHDSSPPPPQCSSYDLDYIISFPQSHEEPLSSTMWSAGSSSQNSNYNSTVHGSAWSLNLSACFTVEIQRETGSDHLETSLHILSFFPTFVLMLFIKMSFYVCRIY